jgi:sugar lactone lactonase YvrE
VSARSAALFLALSTSLFAATSTTWEVSGFNELVNGRLSGLSLTADGLLRLGPTVRWTSNLDQPVAWALVNAPDGTLYAATGNQGKVFRIGADGRSTLVWTAPESEVFALLVDSKGILYAASSPNGGVYRIDPNGAKQIWRSPARYLWALQQGSDGTLYVATGQPGKVFRISANGQAAEYYDTGQTNVTALTAGADGQMYAGTDPNGIVYSIEAPGKATVVYDSTLPEIRAITQASNGDLYVAAMGGAASSRSAVPASASAVSTTAVVAANPTVVTVTAAKSNGLPSNASDDDQVQIKSTDIGKSTTSAASVAATSNTAVTEVTGVERSAIYRITPERVIQTLWSSSTSNVYDLVSDGDAVVFGTDERARIYRLTGRRATLVAEAGSGETTRLLTSAIRGELTAVLSNPARILRFGGNATGAGSYESQVHDAASIAHWGHLQWHGTGSGVCFRTRTGNAARPDATWSAWSAPISESGTALISSPPGRYLQWRAEWAPGATAQLDDIVVPYLPQNNPPAIHSVTVTSVSGSNAAKANAGLPTTSNAGAYSITVTDTGEAPPASSSTTSAQMVSHLATTQTQISWQADDPDGDKLVYSIYFRPEDATEWQLVRNKIFENTLLLDPDVFADGRYFFRVVASDAPSNPAQYVQTAEMISSPVVIDNTPPVVTAGPARRTGDAIDVEVEASDRSSSLRLCEYSLDAGMWQPIEAEDGITDSPHERFRLRLERVRPGEHLLVFRVFDAANNAGLAKVLLR